MEKSTVLPRHAAKSYPLFVLDFLLARGPLSGYEVAQIIKNTATVSSRQLRATSICVHELKEAGDARAGKTEGRREKIDYGITEQGKRTLREEP